MTPSTDAAAGNAPQPIEPAEPIEPIESIEPAEPIESIESIEPAEPIESIEPAEPAESIEGIERVEAAPLNMHMQQLAYLRAVERHGSLTVAARRLGVTQPALSQAIAQLERRLGTALLERAGRRRRLTEAGSEVARFASEVLGRATELREWLQEYEAGAGGVLRIGMIDAGSLYVLPQTVRAFREASPGVQVRLVVDRSAVLLDRLTRFELDVAFVVGPPPEGYRSTEVLREPLYVYAPPDSGEPPEQGDWALYPQGRRTRLLIDEGLALRGLRPRVTLESDNPAVLRQMVALGLCWSVLPAEIAEAGTPSLRPQRRDLVAERTLLAVRRAQAPDDVRVSRFLRLVAARGAAPAA